MQEQTFSLDEYESCRLPRRSRHDMKLDDMQRRSIILCNNVTGSNSNSSSSSTTTTAANGRYSSSNPKGGEHDTNPTNTATGAHVHTNPNANSNNININNDNECRYMSEAELKRAERRIYRNRENLRKKAMAHRFFTAKSE